jgi:hypothetical protein
VGRGIALLFHDRGTRRGVSGQQHARAALYPQERPGIHCTGGWVGPRAGLEGAKYLVPTGFDSGPSSPVAQSLYRLSYRAHTYAIQECNFIKAHKILSPFPTTDFPKLTNLQQHNIQISHTDFHTSRKIHFEKFEFLSSPKIKYGHKYSDFQKEKNYNY